MTSTIRCLVIGIALITGGAHRAEAQFVSPYGFSIRSQTSIRKAPAQVYEALAQVGQWWSSEHSYTGDAKNMSIDLRPGGCFCERLPNGGGIEHMRVLYAQPGEMLRLSGALGPLQPLGVTGTMSLKLTSSGGGTTVELTYSVGGFSEGGFNQLAPAVSTVLNEQMNRLKSFVETGTAR